MGIAFAIYYPTLGTSNIGSFNVFAVMTANKTDITLTELITKNGCGRLIILSSSQ